jgi:hypothetical protein
MDRVASESSIEGSKYCNPNFVWMFATGYVNIFLHFSHHAGSDAHPEKNEKCFNLLQIRRNNGPITIGQT